MQCWKTGCLVLDKQIVNATSVVVAYMQKLQLLLTTFSVTKGKHICDLHNIPLCLGFFVIVECWGNGTLCFITLLLILL